MFGWSYSLTSSSSAATLFSFAGCSFSLLFISSHPTSIFLNSSLFLFIHSKLKEVAPKTGTAVTREFWKVDLKNTRSILHRHKDAHEEVEEEVIEEWSVSTAHNTSFGETRFLCTKKCPVLWTRFYKLCAGLSILEGLAWKLLLFCRVIGFIVDPTALLKSPYLPTALMCIFIIR